MEILDLNGEWQMRRCGSEEWIRASVPGTVYGDLLNAGRMPDPFYGENERAATELSDFGYEYIRRFPAESSMVSHDRVLLRFEGLDTICAVFLNGQEIGRCENMHRVYEFRVKEHLKPGENELRVRFDSPSRCAEAKQAEYPLRNTGETRIHGIDHLRKAHCMFGWDWAPVLPDMGIWRGVSLVGVDTARITGFAVRQTHSCGTVKLEIRADVECLRDVPLSVSARLTSPGGVSSECEAFVGGGTAVLKFSVNRPELWWPNGFGAHPLYTVSLRLAGEGRELDFREFRVGLRTLRLARDKDVWGESFAFEVNGVKVFAMGADYIPEDSLLSRRSPARTEKLIRACVQANFNLLRVWGGGYYPDDFFYDLCDENGVLVWQDFMFACGAYRFDGAFRENVGREFADNIRRIRYHACLALWCGNNEQELAWTSWGFSQELPAQLKADYSEQFEKFIPSLVRKLDPGAAPFSLTFPSITGTPIHFPH